jgi:hypothetical protein
VDAEVVEPASAESLRATVAGCGVVVRRRTQRSTWWRSAASGCTSRLAHQVAQAVRSRR